MLTAVPNICKVCGGDIVGPSAMRVIGGSSYHLGCSDNLVVPLYSPQTHISEYRCEKHGKQTTWLIYAGEPFCEACVAEKLRELGVKPVFEVRVPLHTNE